MQKVIAYYRVSTKDQEKSGLGLEAQQMEVHDFLIERGLQLDWECFETESGTKNDRPILKRALRKCKKEKALLLIAKLDRLARSVFFIAWLINTKVDFKAVDYPNDGKFELYQRAIDAEKESYLISKRTSAALAAVKARGIKLGEYGSNVLSKKNKQAADEFAFKMKPVIDSIRGEGFNTIRKLTAVLNKRKIRPFSGASAKWHTRSVHSLVKRIEKLTTI